MAQSDRMHRCYTFGYTGAYAESWVTALNGYFDLMACLMNYLRMVTSDCHMLSHLPTSLNDMYIVSGITLHLMLLMIVMFFIDRYNRPLIKDDWYFLRCKLIRLLSVFIRWN